MTDKKKPAKPKAKDSDIEKLAKEIVEQSNSGDEASVAELLEKDPKKREELRHLLIARSYQGPIPPPEMLAAYNEVLPDGAERILKMAEKQSNHRMELEKTAITRQLNQSGRGQIFGFIIAVIAICISAWLAVQGFTVVASVIGGTTVVSLVGAFVYGKLHQREDLKDKGAE